MIFDRARDDLVAFMSSGEPRSYEQAALVLLGLMDELRIRCFGGYPSDINWDFFPDFVVVADLDGCEGYLAPLLQIYDKAALCELAQLVIEEALDGADGADAAEEAIERFEDRYYDCLVTHDDPSEAL
jgi:hypothetical protein